MGRIGIWVTNGALFVLCCFLVAEIVNQFIAASVAVDPQTETVSSAPNDEPTEESKRDPQAIIKRNLFNSAVLKASTKELEPEPVVAEELASTKLPLKLLGTLVADDPNYSYAAVEETDNGKAHVVKISDKLKGIALILAIERRRIILHNAGQKEELVISDDPAPAATAAARPTRKPPARTPVRRRTPNQNNASPEALEKAKELLREKLDEKPADQAHAKKDRNSLLKQAKILPKFEDGTMLGMQVNQIKPGSLFEQMGLQNGDLVVEFNGIEATDTKRGLDMLREFTNAESFELTVQGSDGQERQINYTLE